ncbi:MAG: pantetheine-phosphate adenylyltransferase [Deferribacteres bacterium]|nr:pantetheine-phosphate adenylyltransferase [Deferribacteres bacterium]
MSGKVAIYPGTFDPITYGHLDILERASKVFDKIIIAVASNERKGPLFTLSERIELIELCIKERGLDNVEVDSFDTLLIEYAKNKGANVIIRGLRAISDFEYEFQMALMNRKLFPEIETLFMMPNEQYTYVSSRIVKEIASYGGSVKCLVPEVVEAKLREKFSR